jgi:AcrR family transcriptional regulator
MAIRTDRRAPVSRDRVLSAAMTLADEGGIESLSMRTLGQSLGVKAMSLYNHVTNKDDILTGIVDLVLNEIELPSATEDWEAAIRTCAISAHDALVRHPWACNLLMSSTRVSPARLRYMNSLLGRLREAGFSADATYHAYHALDSHILGFTLWHAGHSIDKEELANFMKTVLPTLRLDEYPYLMEHAKQHLSEGSHKDEGEFEFGLGLILDGLKRIRSTT